MHRSVEAMCLHSVAGHSFPVRRQSTTELSGQGVSAVLPGCITPTTGQISTCTWAARKNNLQSIKPVRMLTLQLSPPLSLMLISALWRCAISLNSSHWELRDGDPGIVVLLEMSAVFTTTSEYFSIAMVYHLSTSASSSTAPP